MVSINSSVRALLLLLSIAAAALLLGALPGQAKADYIVMLCGGGNSASQDNFKTFDNSGNGANDAFTTTVNCSKTDSFPDGTSSYLRVETKGSGKVQKGTAGFEWKAPKDTYYLKMNAYTRENNMQPGWRHQIYGVKDKTVQIFNTICPGCKNSGKSAPATSIYAQRGAWWDKTQKTPFQTIGIRLSCVASSGCARAPRTRADTNSFTFTAGDSAMPQATVAGSPLISGTTVSGAQQVTISGIDKGSGAAYASLLIDGRAAVSSALNPACSVIQRGPITYARNMKPCPEDLSATTLDLDTTKFSDGAHTLSACVVDFSGNRGCNTYQVNWRNTKLPAPVIIKRPNNPSFDQRPLFTFKYDKRYRLICKINKLKWKRCTSPYRPGRLKPGKHVIKVAQVDQAGNLGGVTTFNWRVRRWTPVQCTLQTYNVKLNSKSITVRQRGLRKRLLRYHIYPMSGPVFAGRGLLGTWRRTTTANKTITVQLGKGGVFKRKLSKQLRNGNRVRIAVSVINETRRCNVYNRKTRTKVLTFNSKLRQAWGLSQRR